MLDIMERKRAAAALHESNQRLEQAIVELKSAQQQLIQQERLRALGQMASGIAHDLNNALSPVLGYTEMLLSETNLTEGMRKKLELILTGAEDAASVVERLQTFYRQVPTGELNEAVDLVELVRQIPELTRLKWCDAAQRMGCVIDIALDLHDVPPVLGSASELREVLTNLVLNSVHAMPQGGQITLRLRAEPQHVLLEVSDTGTGMTDEVRSRCFEPFFTTKGEVGTGLGLSVCHGILQRHGGTIEIDTAPGRGTTIRIRLPIALPKDRPAVIVRTSGPLPRWRVLCIDDDVRVLAAAQTLLEHLGQDVEVAPGGSDGVAKFQVGRYDLVITDLGMPGLNGYEVIRMVKAARPETPVILVTGWAKSPGATDTLVETAPDYVLRKPLRLTSLREVLERIAGQERQSTAEQVELQNGS